MNDSRWSRMEGDSPEEKLEKIGLAPGRRMDIRELDQLAADLGMAAYIYFEPDLARESELAADLDEYADVPEYNRPFISVRGFLEFGAENDPTFADRLVRFPLLIEIVCCGEIPREPENEMVPYVKALMPFLDEIDFDREPEGDGYLTY